MGLVLRKSDGEKEMETLVGGMEKLYISSLHLSFLSLLPPE